MIPLVLLFGVVLHWMASETQNTMGYDAEIGLHHDLNCQYIEGAGLRSKTAPIALSTAEKLDVTSSLIHCQRPILPAKALGEAFLSSVDSDLSLDMQNIARIAYDHDPLGKYQVISYQYDVKTKAKIETSLIHALVDRGLKVESPLLDQNQMPNLAGACLPSKNGLYQIIIKKKYASINFPVAFYCENGTWQQMI